MMVLRCYMAGKCFSSGVVVEVRNIFIIYMRKYIYNLFINKMFLYLFSGDNFRVKFFWYKSRLYYFNVRV